MDLLGEKSIALGSDYPFPLGEIRPGRMIDEMDLGEFHQGALVARIGT